MSFRDDITAYADERWMFPCRDNTVWTNYTAINTQYEITRRGLSPIEWKAIFLLYNSQIGGETWMVEGLYLLKAADAADAIARNMEASQFPDRIMISSWSDNASDEILAETPPYHGLNDCAHFVTECLYAGGINVRTTGVPALLTSLRAMADTKTLALTVSAEKAKRIIQADIMEHGDVIIFSSSPNVHNHSVVYYGNEKITMHTRANHPNHPQFAGDWTLSASPSHPLVTLIHFGRDDDVSAVGFWLAGWWQVTWRDDEYYYFFDKNGRVSYTQQAPANLKQPLLVPVARGYWFPVDLKIKICWTDTGTLEEFDFPSLAKGTHLEGKWNGSEDLVADKLS